MKDPRTTSFIADLYSLTPECTGRIGASAYAGGLSDLLDSGWLNIIDKVPRLNLPPQPVSFRFDYLETQGDRIHYNISCASRVKDFHGRRLGTSRNGYLGFYGDQNLPFFKLDLITPWKGGNRLDFRLRDHRGHIAGMYTQSADRHAEKFVNVDGGLHLHLCAVDIRTL